MSPRPEFGATISYPMGSGGGIQSPGSITARDPIEYPYTTYPEVAKNNQEWDSTPQVRTMHYFPEEYGMSSKLVAQQRHMGGHDSNTDVESPVATAASAPPGTPGTPAGMTGFGAVAGAGESKALHSMPRVGGNGEDGGFKKMNPAKVTHILVGLLIGFIVLAAILGGVLGSKAVSDAKHECAAALAAAGASDLSPAATGAPSAPSPSATFSADPSTQTFTVPDQGFVQLDCPALDGQIQTVDMGSSQWKFDMTCGAGFSRGANSDIVAIISYSFYHCLQACASLNQNSGRDVCKGAEFDSDLQTAFTFAGNCFLSNSTSAATAVGSGSKNLKVSGILTTA